MRIDSGSTLGNSEGIAMLTCISSIKALSRAKHVAKISATLEADHGRVLLDQLPLHQQRRNVTFLWYAPEMLSPW